MAETKYLIFSLHCLKNIDGYGTIKHYPKEIRCNNPLIEIPFNDNNPMCYFHGVIRTMRNLNANMVLERLDRRKYNMIRNVAQDEIFAAISENGLLVCYYDKDLRRWELADWDDISHDELTEVQAENIAEQLMAFYDEYTQDPKQATLLQHEYLDIMYR